ncbi:MAG: hypothetical protein PHQ96_00980 [Candidatus Omnitrophica bacterium]|nr:hypothetical protein [Candidatus Omnitrophota bacterium]
MGKKGLCDTCNNGDHCVLTAIFPVWQCEEFSNNGIMPRGHTSVTMRGQKNNSCSNETGSEAGD